MEMAVQVSTWRDLQGPLLAAVQMETTILNILIFLIIAVARLRDSGHVLHDRGGEDERHWHPQIAGRARPRHCHDLLGLRRVAGLVGAGAGGVLGLLFVAYINDVADLLEVITGQEVF